MDQDGTYNSERKEKRIMKRKMTILVVLALCVVLLAGCGCQHEWGDWVSSGKNWTRTCSVCQKTENANAEEMAKEYVVGKWYSSFFEGGFVGDVTYDYFGMSVEFKKDGSFVLKDEGNDTERTGKWEYVSVDSATEVGDFAYLLDGELLFYSMQHRISEDSEEGKLIGWILIDDTGSAQGRLVFCDRKPSNAN